MLLVGLLGCPSQVTPVLDTVNRPRGLNQEWRCTEAPDGAEGEFPIGAAVRVAGPENQVFVLADVLNRETRRDQAVLTGFQCSSPADGCARPVVLPDLPLPIGEPLKGENALLPSMALERVDGRPVLRMLLKQKVEPDCDGDGRMGEDGDPLDQNAIDLRTFRWDAASGPGPAADVSVNDGECIDRGFNAVHVADGVAHACWTEKDPAAPEADDRVSCGVDVDGTWEPERGPTNGGDGDEDHPTFALADDQRFVATHKVNRGAVDSVRVHVLDDTSALGEPIVDFPSAGAQFPDLVGNDGWFSLVYQDDAGIWYSECERASGCATPSDWSAPEPVADASNGLAESAEIPQLAIDGDRQWVVYTYDADPSAEVAARVVAGTRCEGGDWKLEVIRDPAASGAAGDRATDDQSLEFGRPSVVVNRDHHLVHVVFAEFDDFSRREDLPDGVTQDGDVYLCSRAYDPCP